MPTRNPLLYNREIKLDRLSPIRNLFKQSFFFLAGNVFTLLLGFPFQIYVTRQIGAEGLGVFGLIDSGVQMMANLLSFGVAQTMVRYIPHHLALKEYSNVRGLVRKGGWLLIAAGISGYIVIAGSLPFFGTFWPQLRGAEDLIMTMGLLLPLGLLLFFVTQVLRGFQDIRYIVVGSSFLQLIVKITLTVILFSLGFKLIGYVWAVVISTLFALLWMTAGVFKKLFPLEADSRAAVSVSSQEEWKSYAGIMYGNSLVGVVTAPLDRLMLGFFSGSAAVGVLMVVKTLYSLPGIFLQMFLSIIAPMFSSAHAQEERDRNQHLYHVCTDWLMRLSIPLIIFLWVFADNVLLLFGKEFPQQGGLALKLLLIGQIVNLAAGPIGNLLNMSGLEKVMFRVSIVQSLFMVIAIAVSVPFWGINGAAFGIAFGMIFSNIAALWIGRRNLSLRWWDDRYKRWIMLALFCVGIGLLSKRFIEPIAAPQLAAILFFIYIISHGMFIIKGLHADDKEIWLAIRSKFSSVSQL